MKLPFSQSKSIVGLDIGASSVKAVELTVKPKGMELLHLGVAPLPADAIVQGAFLNSGAIVEAVRQAIDSAGIKTKNVATALSGHAVIVKKISMPVMSREELEESIRWEAEQYIPFDINEVNLDFQIVREGDSEEQMEVLLVAAKRDLIDDYTQVIVDAGLTPAVLDVASFAIENAYEYAFEPAVGETAALVNIGSQVVNINIVSDGVPAFTRDMTTGGQAYTEEIQKALSVGFDEAEQIKLGGTEEDSQEVVPQEVEQAIRGVTENMIGEIARSLDFYCATSAESEINRIVLAGGGCKVSGLDTAFQGKTNIPVERLNPLARMLPSSRFNPDELDEIAPSLGVSVGLAMRRMSY